MPATVVVDPALPKQANYPDGLLQHLEWLVRLRPAVPEYTLVQRLAAAHA
jgi:hypothetical protein